MNVVALAAAAGAVLFALSKSSKAAPAAPATVLARVTAALASGNPATMRALAAQLRAEGFPNQASDLERSAVALETLPPATSSATGSSLLKRGSNGDAVRAWQTFLVAHGYSVTVDGDFGVQTEDATKAFQRASNLTADGIVGAETLKASQRQAPAEQVKAPPPAVAPPSSLPPPSLAPATAVPKSFKRGSTGPDVVAWQAFLRTQGFAVDADGQFGVQTEDATKAFQRAHNLTADGVVGPDTLKASLTAKPIAALPPAPMPVLVPAPAPLPAAPAAALPAVPLAPRTLAIGASGSDVLAWQTFLKAQGYAVTSLDGVFGPQTSDATKAFQRARGIAADGVVGPDTLKASLTVAPAVQVATTTAAPAPTIAAATGSISKAISQTLKRDSGGPQVIAWQLFLRGKAGYTSLQIDAKFGVQTEDATKAFQRAHNLTADGIVGPATKAAADKVAAAAPATSSAPAPAPAPAPALAPAAVAVAAAVVSAVVAQASKWPILKLNMQSAYVKQWQAVLVAAGYKLSVDGFFGAETDAATRAWQKSRGLTADGVVGPASVAALKGKPPGNVTVSGDFDLASPLPGVIPAAAPAFLAVPPDRSLAAQLALHLTEATPGAEDRALVQAFQRMRGLNPTGNYGPGTAKALLRFGLLPPHPFYWPSEGSERAKRDYRRELLQHAARDPVRAREFEAAASRLN